MLKELQQIEKNNIIELISFLERSLQDKSFINDNIGLLKIDNGFGTTFYSPINPLFRSISLNQVDNKIVGIELIGDFNISINELEVLFGEYREQFSSRDEMYFYFFNEYSQPQIMIRASQQLNQSDRVKIISFKWGN